MILLIIILFLISMILSLIYDRNKCKKIQYISIGCLIICFLLAFLL